jgi:hypothetical protein
VPAAAPAESVNAAPRGGLGRPTHPAKGKGAPINPPNMHMDDFWKKK